MNSSTSSSTSCNTSSSSSSSSSSNSSHNGGIDSDSNISAIMKDPQHSTFVKYSKEQNNLNTNFEETHHSDERIEKSRERNREHAKRTRLRKKALIEGMKGKLLDLQTEAAKLQQLFEESNTANILLCLSTKSDPSNLDTLKKSTSEISLYSSTDELLKQNDNGFKSDNPVRGNIIEQLRSRVRAEAAQQVLVNAARSKPHATSSSSASGSLTPKTATTPLGLQIPGMTFESDGHSLESDSAEIEFNVSDKLPMDLDDVETDDGEGEEFETMQPVAEGVVNWKNGTMVLSEGSVRKLSQKEIEIYRKERNRIHAKLTRDRKKLFTSRMQQMINSLERQNTSMRNRLKALAQIGNSMTTDSQDNDLVTPYKATSNKSADK
jgi:hypothetical protein